MRRGFHLLGAGDASGVEHGLAMISLQLLDFKSDKTIDSPYLCPREIMFPREMSRIPVQHRLAVHAINLVRSMKLEIPRLLVKREIGVHLAVSTVMLSR